MPYLIVWVFISASFEYLEDIEVPILRRKFQSTTPGVNLIDTDYGLLGQDDYGVLNLYLAIANVNEGWELSIIGENITDEVYIVRAAGDDGGSYMDMLGRPATWSINARFDF